MTGERWSVICGDAVEELRKLPDACADLVLKDPPYNIGKAAWDKIEDFTGWFREWVLDAERVLRDNGVMYIFCGDIEQVAEIMGMLRRDTGMRLLSFCIWDKGEQFRVRMWRDRDPEGKTAPRRWFQAVEYCLHLVKGGGDAHWSRTGLDCVYSDSRCFGPLKEWYRAECARLGIGEKEIAAKYTEATGRKPFMIRHYFKDNQFELPTREVWEAVYVPLGFGVGYEELKESYDGLRKSYEDLREEYETLRYVHVCDADARNVWRCPPIGSADAVRIHPTQKPVALLRRLIRTSSRPGDVVLDPFAGSGSCGVAAVREGRRFVGIERDAEMAGRAAEWIEREAAQIGLEEGGDVDGGE